MKKEDQKNNKREIEILEGMREDIKKKLSASSLEAGYTFGKYKILKKIGEGGMGIVFLVYDEEEKKEVALKIIKGNVPNPLQQEQRMEREQENLSKLQHPNIIELYEADEFYYKKCFIPYYTMEYLPNNTPLSKYVKNRNSIDWVVNIIIDIAKALTYIHEKNIIHRDLKPSNILLIGNVPKIIDFGLSRILGQTETFRPTRSRMLLGSIEYMSPEQLKTPKTVDKRTDIYSLAVILYRLLTNKKLFPFLTQTHNPQNVYKKLDEKLKDISSLVDFSDSIHLNTHLEKICRKGMAQREDRYQSVDEFLKDLENYKHISQKCQDYVLFHKETNQELSITTDEFFIDCKDAQIEISEAKTKYSYARMILHAKKMYLVILKKIEINNIVQDDGKIVISDGDEIKIAENFLFYKKKWRSMGKIFE